MLAKNYNIDKTKTINFIIYMVSQFIGSEKKKAIIKNIIKYIEVGKSDLFIYRYVKKNISIDFSSNENYLNNLKKKAHSIYMAFAENESISGNNNIFGNENITSKDNILDIGTEDINYLKYLEKEFGCDAYGINISDNINYTGNTKNYAKFKVYDKVIPFKDKYFKLISILSVIHHLNDEIFSFFVAEACRVCSGYIYVKDVDLTTPTTIDLFVAQHDIFEGCIIGSKPYYRNNNTTADKIIKEFKKNKFKLKTINYYNNFNNTFIAIFSRL